MLDLAVNTSNSGILSLLISTGGGGFRAAINLPVGRTGVSPQAVVGDFNRDGIPDLAIPQNNFPRDGTINILIGKGDGTFFAPIVVSSPSRTGRCGQPRELAIADFDGDGNQDLFAYIGACDEPDSIVLLGKGDGTFGVPIRGFWSYGYRTTVGDFNHDGKPDLAGTSTYPFPIPDDGRIYEDLSKVWVLLNGEPSFYLRSIINAASRLPGNVALGEVITLTGNGLGPTELVTQQLAPDGLVDTVLAGVRVFVNQLPARLLAVQENQINAIVPYFVGSPLTVWAENNGKRTNTISVAISPAAPGIFTADGSGKGQGAILNEDGTPNSEVSPAAKGSVITFFATGEGSTKPFGIDGKLAGDPTPVPVLPVTVGINDGGAEVLSAGGAPGQVAGIMRVVARIPVDAPSGSTKISIGLGEYFSQPGVTVAIQ
jgi:uncharacterized protein (TIGR03437 family)